MDNPPLGQDDLAPSLMAPVPKQHTSHLHVSLVSAIIVIMVVGVGALFSCCYHWGWHLQINQTQNSGNTDQSNQLPNYIVEDPAASTGATAVPEHATHQTTDSSKAQEMKQMYTTQVLMPGDDIPKFIAWTAPHRSPAALDPTVV